MAAASDWLERILVSHVFGSGTFSKPAVIAIALCSGNPSDSHTGVTIPEIPNAGAYARQTLNPSSNNWYDPAALTDGTTGNLSAITFPQATSDAWGWISGVAILDSATYGAGNMLYHGALTTPKLIQNNDQFVFGVSGITIQMDN